MPHSNHKNSTSSINNGTKKAQLSIIIPTVNAANELDLAIKSIKQNSDLPYELIILVDPDLLTRQINQDILGICDRHHLTPIINDKNLGPYGSWNKGAKLASCDYLIFATDDQYFAPHWDSELLKHWRPKRLVAGRLVEPGIIPVWRTNIKANFGTSPDEFRESEFLAWCAQQKSQGFVKDGFFIPLLQKKSDFVKLGGYPTAGQFGTSAAISNDDLYIQKAIAKGYEFGTASSSYSYHFQASSWKKKSLHPRIAAVILTYNEQKHLPKCLSSIKGFAEPIVIDSGSTDDTINIAKKFKAKIITHQFKNFADQRNFALQQVKDYDWVLFIDADETLEANLKQELLSFACDIYLDGVEIKRKNYIFGQWIAHTDWYPDYRLVFVRPKMVTFEGLVHERIKFIKGNGQTAKSQYHLIHQNYDSVEEFITKNLIQYPKSSATSLHESGVKFSVAELVGKSINEFFRRFFLAEGWRDGLYGFVLSFLMGIQTAITYIYLWELQGKTTLLTKLDQKAILSSLRQKSIELSYWINSLAIERSTGLPKYFYRLKRKLQKLVHRL